MKSEKEFIRLIDGNFFRHLNKNSLIPFDCMKSRQDFLKGVYASLLENVTNYEPRSPRKYISFPKNHFVVRLVPTFELDDYCIYYYCIKSIEEYIAKNRTPGTFGNYRLGGMLRNKENLDFEPGFEDSYNENSFNAYAWRKEYSDYQAKLYGTSLEMGKKFQFAVYFDIANFYDCIRLDLLEVKIKQAVKNPKLKDEIHILFSFLNYWNKINDSKKIVGIPQDEVGDCSRILANFFLQEYDQYLYKECKAKGATFLRYTDDQIIFANSREDAENLMFKASRRLIDEGLNISAKKVKTFTNFQEFDDMYGFTIYEKLKFESQEINKAFNLFSVKKDQSKDLRASSLLRRLLHDRIDKKHLSNQNRIKLLAYLWDESFLLFANDHYMIQMFKLLKNDAEKEEFLATLRSLGKKTSFDSYKIYLGRFMQKMSIPL